MTIKQVLTGVLRIIIPALIFVLILSIICSYLVSECGSTFEYPSSGDRIYIAKGNKIVVIEADKDTIYIVDGLSWEVIDKIPTGGD